VYHVGFTILIYYDALSTKQNKNPLTGFLKQRIALVSFLKEEVFVAWPYNCHLIKREFVV
jgi:hypothetical protein